jgi:hypothetical protein
MDEIKRSTPFLSIEGPNLTPFAPTPPPIQGIAFGILQAPSPSTPLISLEHRELTPLSVETPTSLTQTIKLFRFILSDSNLKKYIDYPLEDLSNALKRRKKAPSIPPTPPLFKGSLIDLLRLEMKENGLLKDIALYLDYIESIPLAPGYQSIFDLLLHVVLRPFVINQALEQDLISAQDLIDVISSIFPLIQNPEKILENHGLQTLLHKAFTEILILDNPSIEYTNEIIEWKKMFIPLQAHLIRKQPLDEEIDWLIRQILLSTPSFIRPQRLLFHKFSKESMYPFFLFTFSLIRRGPLEGFTATSKEKVDTYTPLRIEKATQTRFQPVTPLSKFQKKIAVSSLTDFEKSIKTFRAMLMEPYPKEIDKLLSTNTNFLETICSVKAGVLKFITKRDDSEITELLLEYSLIEYLSNYLIDALLNYTNAFSEPLSLEDLEKLFQDEIEEISIPCEPPILETIPLPVRIEEPPLPPVIDLSTPPPPQTIFEALHLYSPNEEIHLHLLFAIEKFLKIENSYVEALPLLQQRILLDCCIAIEKTLSLHKNPEVEEETFSHNFVTLHNESTLKLHPKLIKFLKKNPHGILMARYPYIYSTQESIVVSLFHQPKSPKEQLEAIYHFIKNTISIVFGSTPIQEIPLPTLPKKSLPPLPTKSPIIGLADALTRNSTVRSHPSYLAKAKQIHLQVKLLQTALHLETVESDPLQSFQTLLEIGKLYEECFHLMLIMHDTKTLKEATPHQRHDLVWLFDQIGLQEPSLRTNLAQINLMNSAHYFSHKPLGPNSPSAMQAWRDLKHLAEYQKGRVQIGDDSFTPVSSPSTPPDLSRYEAIRRHLLAYLPTLLSQMP